MPHTSGDWECSGPEVLQADDHTKHIATFWNHNSISPAEAEDNARLSASAPALLAACEAVMAANSPDAWEEALVMVDEAIVAAKDGA